MNIGNGKSYISDFRFGGNLCIESCPVGICSNAAYGYGVVESTKTEQFYGNPDVLPGDGTICQVTFTLLAE